MTFAALRGPGLRVGLFTLAGAALLVLTTALVGGRWFAASEPATMRFDSSVYGLQIGAPVVLRGVRVGQVSRITLAPAGPHGLEMPVTAEFDRALLAGVLGPAALERGALMPALVPVLVRQGLVARLATQSLLTGLLYVDLDIDPARAAAPALASAATAALPEIPTERTQLQTLQAQLQALDLQQIGQDLAAVAASTRELLADPRARQALVHTAEAAQALKALAQRLDHELGPLARAAGSTLAESRRTLQQLAPAAERVAQQVGAAASQVGQAAAQWGGAAAQVQALAAAGTPLVADLRQAATELGRSAATLREAAAEDSALRLNADRALQDLARAARSLGELGDLLERHPDALLRGRGAAPAGPH
jgi:paraquat-inducible protein B